MFGGRILKDEKSLSDYSIKAGSTLHVLRKVVVTEKGDDATEMESLEGYGDSEIGNRQRLIEDLVRSK